MSTVFEIIGWPFIKSRNIIRQLIASPLEMYSKFVLAYHTLLSELLKLIGRWSMADCYFKLCQC